MSAPPMTERERYLATMFYRNRDRCPICDFKFWGETLPIWKEQGLPAEVEWNNSDDYFGMDNWSWGFPANVGLQPNFGWTEIEDRGDQQVIRDHEGVVLLRKKTMGSIPLYLSHTLVDRDSWKKEFLPKLNPDDVRIDAEQVQKWLKESEGRVRSLFAGSLYGWIRNWMGVEALSYLVYDDPAFFEEMVNHLTDLTLTVMDKVFAIVGNQIDTLAMWEDMCYNAGPLLSPTHFRRYMVPNYCRITEKARRHGVELVYLDSDGKIDELLPYWLESGVNTLFPIEVGTWKSDPIAFRRQYGKDLRMLGGFDKHLLALGPQAIEAEIRRLIPLVEEGGYIPFADHRVPPDVPLKNYVFYLRKARQYWGYGINLKPMDPRIESLSQ